MQGPRDEGRVAGVACRPRSRTRHAMGLRLHARGAWPPRHRPDAPAQARTRGESAGFVRRASRCSRRPPFPHAAAVAGGVPVAEELLELEGCETPCNRWWGESPRVTSSLDIVWRRASSNSHNRPPGRSHCRRCPPGGQGRRSPRQARDVAVPLDRFLVVACGERSEPADVVAVGADVRIPSRSAISLASLASSRDLS